MINRSTWIQRHESNLDKKIDSILKETKTDEVQGRIAKNIFFRFNSVNVVIVCKLSHKNNANHRES
jgi:hypothetical protein